jgi:hypothetical protein
MDLAEFIALLTRSGLDVTEREVAEMLWLAQYASAPAAGERSPPDRPGSEPPSEQEGLEQADEPGPLAPSGTILPLHLPEVSRRQATPGRDAPAGAGVGGISIPMPASTALPQVLDLVRALRPLKLRHSGGRRRTLDEPATADASARAGTLLPVMRAATERSLSLTLVTDTGPAMAIWSKLEAELAGIMAYLGAFRDVQRWYLRGDRDGRPAVARGVSADHPSHDVSELVDPQGRRLVLVLTDGADSLWYAGAMAEALRAWGQAGPVAILQPLPQQLWARTALAPVLGTLFAGRQATPNTELTFVPRAARFRPSSAVPADGHVPVPILEIRSDWLGRWASFVREPSSDGFHCAVTHAAARPPVTAPVDSTAAERVRRFTEQASPQARQLACYLSTVPLSLPIARHVQQALLPASQPSHLAEVLLGGLVTTHAADRDEWRYEFYPGVRDLLLGGLDRFDAHRVLTTVSRGLAERFGRGADEFIAIAVPPTASDGLPGSTGSAAVASGPFAEITARVVQRITGKFPAAVASDESAASALDEMIRRYQRTGRIADIDAAIATLRSVGGLGTDARIGPGTDARAGGGTGRGPGAGPGGGRPEPAHRIFPPRELAAALRSRYLALGNGADLDEAIDVLRLAAPAAADQPALYHQLAETLALRQARTGSAADADSAVQAARMAAGQVRPGTDEASRYSATLAVILARHARTTGSATELDEAIELLRRSGADAALPDAERAELMIQLSIALRARAASASPDAAMPDLDEAVANNRSALALTAAAAEQERPADLARRHAELGAALLDRNHVKAAISGGTGTAALREAASSFETAANLTRSTPEELAVYLARLGITRLELARRTDGREPELADAVSALRGAVSQTLPDSEVWLESVVALASALIIRFGRDRRLGDLLEAEYLLAQAVSAPSQPGVADLSTLSARLLLARAYASAGHREKAREILSTLRSELSPDHPDYRAAVELNEELRR